MVHIFRYQNTPCYNTHFLSSNIKKYNNKEFYFIFIRTLWFLDRLDYNNDVPCHYINFD